MIDEKKEREKWYKFLKSILTVHRIDYPDDKRSDTEILKSFTNYCVKKGTLKRGEHGKIIFPILDEEGMN